MDLTTLQTLIGDLTNDPNHDRYSLTQINIELDNSQDVWNAEAKILKDTVTLTTTAGARQYALSGLTGTPISFARVTHRGIELQKKDKSWFDLYTSTDWTVDTGTPRYYLIEATDPDIQFLTVYPTPRDADAGANLVVEYIKRHTSMSASSDQPFNSSPLATPYHYGLGYDVSSRLLIRDPNELNVQKVMPYKKLADIAKANVIQVFKALEREEPLRLRGGKVWQGGGALWRG